MLKVKELSITKELTQEEFIEELGKFINKPVAVSITGGAILDIKHFENFDFCTYNNGITLEDFVSMGSTEDENYTFSILLDCVESFLKDEITDQLLLVLDIGTMVQIIEE